MNRRVNPSRVARRLAGLLEQERRALLAAPEADLPDERWRDGFCDGLAAAQRLVRKG